MNRSSKIMWMVGLVLVAGLAISTSSFRSTAGGSGSAPLPALVETAATENQSPVDSDPFGQPSTAELTKLVAQRLRDWEDRDEPAQRLERTRELEKLLGTADKLDVIAALPVELRDFAFGLPVFQQWMSAEPEAAAEWMRAHPEISEARLFTLLKNWDERDRAAMQAYVSAIPPGGWQQRALAAASHLALESDPVAAIDWARQMIPDGRRTGLLALATADWAKGDPTAAAQWVSQVNDAAVREPLQGSLAVAYAETDPMLAAEWAFGAIRPGAALDRSLAEIAGAWAKDEPTAVAAWVMRFPAGDARRQIMEQLVNVWANRDRTAAEAWVNDLPDAQWRRQGTALLAALPQPTAK